MRKQIRDDQIKLNRQLELLKINEQLEQIKSAIFDMSTTLDLQKLVSYKHIAEYHIDCIFAINYKRLTEGKDE